MNLLAKKSPEILWHYSSRHRCILVWRYRHRIKSVDTPLPFINFIEELQCLRIQLAITALEYCKYEPVVDVFFPRCSWERVSKLHLQEDTAQFIPVMLPLTFPTNKGCFPTLDRKSWTTRAVWCKDPC